MVRTAQRTHSATNAISHRTERTVSDLTMSQASMLWTFLRKGQAIQFSGIGETRHTLFIGCSGRGLYPFPKFAYHTRMSEYRVSLEIYNGPLDLLLYLIRRDELDIHDIPIARITQQYVSYVELLTDLDPNLTGEFLVMAATLMEVKTRMLLPAAVIEEGTEEENELDPRADLVRQLLQYKAFKDAAGELSTAAELHSQRLPRKPGKLDLSDQKEVDLEDVQIWDLFDAFRNVMESIGQLNRQHEVIYDDTPVELHAEDILHRLKTDGSMTFARIFEGRTRRTEVVGLFIAVLELIRMKKILAVQPDNFEEIAIELNPNPPEEDEIEELGRRIEEAEQHAADEEAAREE